MLKNTTELPNGVMLNAYPDSIGHNLSDIVAMLQLKEFKDVFSLFYILPTFFNSDLDRGFSIIDYNLNKDLVSKDDLKALEELNIQLKFDIVLNHLSVNSPQFKDLLKHGDASKYKDFFINWNTFWQGNGTKNTDGIVVPEAKHLNKLFMRKSGLPILKVPFPNGEGKPYWNTFYQQITYHPITVKEVLAIEGISTAQAEEMTLNINKAIENTNSLDGVSFNGIEQQKAAILKLVNSKRTFLGQMDVNAKSDLVWQFYEDTLAKVSSFGCKILRLDAFAYLHKQVGQTNFFNTPGTWQYLERIKNIATKNNLTLLPEIHAEYGTYLHDAVAKEGYQIYDFFLPGLVIHTLENATNKALLTWAKEIITKRYNVVNMLGCHDGIPVLDLKGKTVNNTYNAGLLEDAAIEGIMATIIERGGRVKNLYDPSGKKISYYQVNATFFSALGESEQKLLLARAIQLFMPGVPQVWYLDLFAGKNNYAAADNAGSGGHKEINRTTLTNTAVLEGLKKTIVKQQLKLMRLRNTSKAFSGNLSIANSKENELHLTWRNNKDFATLKADLSSLNFTVEYTQKGEVITDNMFV